MSAFQFSFPGDSCVGVIPYARVFTSGRRNLACGVGPFIQKKKRGKLRRAYSLFGNESLRQTQLAMLRNNDLPALTLVPVKYPQHFLHVRVRINSHRAVVDNNEKSSVALHAA
jgi:hypothetical protein